MEGCHIATVELRSEYSEVTHRHLKWAGGRLAVGVLPYLEATATLKVHSDAGVTLPGLATRVGQHTLGYGVIFENSHIDAEHINIPVPRLSEVGCSNTNLLDARYNK